MVIFPFLHGPNGIGKTVIFERLSCRHYQWVLISVHFHFFPTNVVLSGDFSVYGSLTESEKLSLEGTFFREERVNGQLFT